MGAVVINACAHLDIATRLSRECCKKIVNEDAIHIILRLLRSCNRSSPHMELLKYALNVLHSLSGYSGPCKAIFAASDSVDILVELMQMYRDKHTIFVKACRVLQKMCASPQQRQEFASMDEMVKRLDGIYNIIRLKYKREAEHVNRLKSSTNHDGGGTPAFRVIKTLAENISRLMKSIQQGKEESTAVKRLDM